MEELPICINIDIASIATQVFNAFPILHYFWLFRSQTSVELHDSLSDII